MVSTHSQACSERRYCDSIGVSSSAFSTMADGGLVLATVRHFGIDHTTGAVAPGNKDGNHYQRLVRIRGCVSTVG